MKRHGYTIIELLVFLFGITSLILFFAGIYVLCHFLAKLW
jgi:hypothetical protein